VRFALVSREVFPFIGGGLSRYVTATAETLAPLGEVTIFTTNIYESRAEELAGSIEADVKLVFVPEPDPDELGSYYHTMHRWSANAYQALKREYGTEGPDLIEFPDYMGEGFVTIQARRALEPMLRKTCVAVRLYTTSELTSVLNGYLPTSFAATVLFDLERYSLRRADRILAPGGDVYSAYQRFFGKDCVAPVLTVRHPVLSKRGFTTVAEQPAEESPLRLLYVGRLERRKGVQNLIRVATAALGHDWSLTLVGGDTQTAPLGTSMRSQLELMAADDARIDFRSEAGVDEVATLIGSADLVVLPSLWECWPNAALEAFAKSKPVLATPTGGYLELVQPGRSGWLTHDTSQTSLARILERLVETRDDVRELGASGAPRRLYEELTDREGVRESYSTLVEEIRAQPQPARPSSDSLPLVSVVIPYHGLDEFVEETVQSVVDQSYPRIEVVLVNDGSLRDEDAVLDDLANRYPVKILTQENSGLGSARNFGISQSNGVYVFPLDADDLAAPTFVERCVEILEEEPFVAYVTSWSQFIDDTGTPIKDVRAGYQPLGICRALRSLNVAGSAEAIFRKRLFELGLDYSVDLTSYEDWEHFRRLGEAGYEGRIIPERLLSYRIRETSMVRTIVVREHDRLIGEIDAHLIEAGTAWTSKSA
jgi:glycogen(starch) synthase